MIAGKNEGLRDSFPVSLFATIFGQTLSACCKYGGRLVKCDCLFGLIAVMCRGILQLQT